MDNKEINREISKEEILSKSRKENKNKDLYSIEVQNKAGTLSSLVALFIATVFFIFQILLGQGFNFGIYAILCSAGSVNLIVKSVYMKNRRDIILASIYTIATLVFICLHIYQLITESTIL